MEVSSPPKRITRARAAAKAGSASASTAPARAPKAAAAAPPKPTTTRTSASMKRKTRSDEEEDEESRQPTGASSSETMNKPAKTRGRPRKVVDPEPETKPAATTQSASHTAARATRGRAKKTVEEAPVPEPPKTTRTRTRKTHPDEDKTPAAPEPVKKATRGRAASSAAKSAGTVCSEPTTNPTPGLKSNISRPASRIGTTKKSVTFQEPEKENMVPPPANKAKSKTDTDSATGMRAKPVRKTVAAGRATRASARTATTASQKEKPTPLSPKKDGQNRPLSRASNSDDELATYDKTPLKPLMKSPVKPPNNRKLDIGPPVSMGNEEAREQAQEDDELAGTSVFASPARRLPSTPFKDTMKSPAKRVEGVPTLLFSQKNEAETVQSPLKAPILQSPAKRPQAPIMAFQAPSTEHSNQPRSPVKMSLLQSPAKRPMSPFKFTDAFARPVDNHPSSPTAPSMFIADEQIALVAEEQHEDVEQNIEVLVETADDEDVEMSQGDEEDFPQSFDQLEFPGRLSAVLPRHADPSLQDKPSPLKALSAAQLEPIAITSEEIAVTQATESVEAVQQDPMELDEVEADEADRPTSPSAETPPRAAIRPFHSNFGLVQEASLPQGSPPSVAEVAPNSQAVSNEESDLTVSLSAVPATPTPGASKTPRSGLPSNAIKNAGRAIRSVSRGSKLGFTPLAKQRNEWRLGSPLKTDNTVASPDGEEYSLLEDLPAGAAQSPAKGTFFDDEMRVRAEMEAGAGSDAEAEMMAAIEADLAASFEDPVFDDISVTNEDVELAAEANEMSLLEPELMETPIHDDSISEASQEYGDENAVPIDPALLGAHAPQSTGLAPPVTPMRPSTVRTFNTTTKVPLKPADDSTPRSAKKRSASASRLPPQRPAGPTRNATVISYSPTKESSSEDMLEQDEQDEQYDHPPVTPTKCDIWSSMGTPARTPRQDLNPALLRGAVVFVDVHTSEGADASTLFVELLTQMGARCVKSWPWNPSGPTNGDISTTKIGITHVVYKDGGKRTMEKVRESGGVVQCVGVSWVLDCERENEWLDEAPYYIDTSLVPRGGARRRKSMEPKALANLNGTLVTPVKQTSTSARECQTVPNNHMNRRDSTAWMRSPSNPDENDDDDMEFTGDDEWDGSMLTPVPKTPAPEAIHRYVTEIEVTPETPGAEWSTEYSPEKEQMLTRTAPPKQSAFAELGQGLLSQHKDQSVMMRLMAARRKSMQFAPKIASPLSKAWN
ncbi:hypothetical protein SCARD494_09901 [Seiridium cardinale]